MPTLCGQPAEQQLLCCCQSAVMLHRMTWPFGMVTTRCLKRPSASDPAASATSTGAFDNGAPLYSQMMACLMLVCVLRCRLIRKEVEFNHKRGFKDVFERGTMHLYFNFKRARYRR